MTPAVRALHTDAVQAAVARLAGVAPEALRLLGGFESFVYEAEVNGEPRILKSTWAGRRTPEQLEAEAHFLRYLADHGAGVCGALPLSTGNFVETVPAEDDAFHVTAFEKAPGEQVLVGEWDHAHFERCGELIGTLHRLATDYTPPPPPAGRPTWESEYGEIAGILEREPVMAAHYDWIFQEIAQLPRERGAFGPMHGDLHSHNMFWHDGRPKAFDFDDMLHFYFVSDLAIVLYYSVLNLAREERTAHYHAVREPLLRGYAREHALPAWCMNALPLFLALREHTLRAVVIRSVPRGERGEWWDTYIRESKHRVREGRPPLDIQL